MLRWLGETDIRRSIGKPFAASYSSVCLLLRVVRSQTAQKFEGDRTVQAPRQLVEQIGGSPEMGASRHALICWSNVRCVATAPTLFFALLN